MKQTVCYMVAMLLLCIVCVSTSNMGEIPSETMQNSNDNSTANETISNLTIVGNLTIFENNTLNQTESNQTALNITDSNQTTNSTTPSLTNVKYIACGAFLLLFAIMLICILIAAKKKQIQNEKCPTDNYTESEIKKE